MVHLFATSVYEYHQHHGRSSEDSSEEEFPSEAILMNIL
jgi:hypothetical protein